MKPGIQDWHHTKPTVVKAMCRFVQYQKATVNRKALQVGSVDEMVSFKNPKGCVNYECS